MMLDEIMEWFGDKGIKKGNPEDICVHHTQLKR